MGIYQRDNINYSSMLDNIIKNRIEKGKELGKLYQDQGKIWGDTARDIGQMVMRATEYEQAQNELNELKAQKDAAEAQRAKLVNEASQLEQSYYNPTTFDYQSRNQTTSTPNRSYMKSTNWMVHANPDNYYTVSKPEFKVTNNEPDYASIWKEQWLRDNPGKTEEDYYSYMASLQEAYDKSITGTVNGGR